MYAAYNFLFFVLTNTFSLHYNKAKERTDEQE